MALRFGHPLSTSFLHSMGSYHSPFAFFVEGKTTSIENKWWSCTGASRGLEVHRIATARSRSLRTMGRAAHCARFLRTLRLGAPDVPELGGVGVG